MNRPALLILLLLTLPLLMALTSANDTTPVCGEPVTSDAILSEDLPCGISITARNVTVDLSGYTINGDVVVERRGATVRDGTIDGFVLVEAGIFGHTVLLENLTIEGGTDPDEQRPTAVYFEHQGGATIRDSTLHGSVRGMADNFSTTVTGSTIRGSGNLAAISLDCCSTIENNTIFGDVRISSHGEFGGDTFKGNTVFGSASFDSGGNEITGNTFVGGGIRSIQHWFWIDLGGGDRIIANSIDEANVGIAIGALGQEGSMDDIVVRDNVITSARVGMSISNRGWPDPSAGGPSLAGTLIEGNVLKHTRGDGIVLQLVNNAANSNITGNVLRRTGFAEGGDGIRVEAEDGLAGGLTLGDNKIFNTAALAINAPGVVDGGGNHAPATRDPQRCIGVVCTPPASTE